MKKRFISTFLVIVLLSSFSFVGAADSTDPVLDGTGSGWSDSSTGFPSEMAGSWWRYIFDWVRGLFSYNKDLTQGWGASSYPSGYVNSWYNRVRDDLDKSYSLASGYSSGWAFNDNSLTVTAPSSYANSSDFAIIQGMQYINMDVEQIKQNTVSIANYTNSASTHLYNIRVFLKDIHDVIANPTDIAMRNNMENSYSAVNDEFMSGSGGSSDSIKASSSEYGEVKALGGIVRSLEPSGRDMSHLSGAFGDGDNSLLGWFTSRTAQELNPIMNNTNLRSRGNNDDFVDFLAPNIDLIEGSRNDD